MLVNALYCVCACVWAGVFVSCTMCREYANMLYGDFFIPIISNADHLRTASWLIAGVFCVGSWKSTNVWAESQVDIENKDFIFPKNGLKLLTKNKQMHKWTIKEVAETPSAPVKQKSYGYLLFLCGTQVRTSRPSGSCKVQRLAVPFGPGIKSQWKKVSASLKRVRMEGLYHLLGLRSTLDNNN